MTRMAMIMLCAAMSLICFGGSSNTLAETNFDPLVERVHERLVEASAKGASGILRITYGGETLVESGFGSASCTDDEKVTSDHFFMIGSITKIFTGLLGFVLEEKGVFSLDDTVSHIVPDFKGPIGKVTLRQLLNHTGGLPDLINRDGVPVPYAVEYDYEPVSRAEFIVRAGLAELISPPGEKKQYSNLGYQLLAAIYEIATEQTYPDLLRRHIYAPAKIKDTDFWFSDTKKRIFADGCRTNNEHWGNPIDEKMWSESGPSWNLAGAGGLLSTAASLGNLFEGIGTGVYFDAPKQLEEYKASKMFFSKTRQQRVMGVLAGSNGIFTTVTFWADNDRFSIILMMNRADQDAVRELFEDVMALFPPDSFTSNKN